MRKYLILIGLMGFSCDVYGELAGGRPNSFSGGNNAFAGVVNPANAVWLADRFDFGAYWVYQKATINNRDHNPLFLPGKADYTYKARNILTFDGAIHKHLKLRGANHEQDATITIATYTVPNVVKLQTKHPVPISGTTPIRIKRKTQIVSAIFSFKLNASHSIGFSLDYLRFSLLRNGYQNSDNPLRSVSPGHVTNNGTDVSSGLGFSLGWRWKITQRLDFGIAWVKKSYCGQFQKYRGFEPFHAKNYTPQTIGGGFSYKFSKKILGRLEVLWSQFGNLPNANNAVLPNGQLNLHKRGSSKASGPGLNDATLINVGLGYKWSEYLSLGAGFSHRIKLPKRFNFLSHTYMQRTIYNTISLGANFKYEQHDLFFVLSNGFKNSIAGEMPEVLGGGSFVGDKKTTALSVSWGYRY